MAAKRGGNAPAATWRLVRRLYSVNDRIVSERPPNDSSFPVTSWSLVRQVSGNGSESREKALEELCRIYWPPVFTFIRSRGKSVAEAEDLTQGFFADFLSGDNFAKADEKRGKLRTYLLTSVARYMSKDHRNQSRLKRGGGEPVLSLDLHREDGTVLLDPVSDVTPESLFDRQWVLTVLHQAADQLAEQYRLRGQPSLFEALRFVISPELDPEPYRSIGERENMSEAAVRVAAHRLKIRYQEALRQIISETLEEGADVEEEMRELRAVFA